MLYWTFDTKAVENNMQLVEEQGARNAVLRQAVFFPEDGISYEAFLKVMLPSHQASARRLLQEGYLTRTESGGIILSPLIKNSIPQATVWNEVIRAFLIRLTTCVAETVTDYWKAEEWAKQATVDPERLRMLALQHGRDTTLPPFQARMAKEALALVSKNKVQVILSETKRRILIQATVGIERAKNLATIRKQSSLVVPTLENVLTQVDTIPEGHLLKAFDWLTDLFVILGENRAFNYREKWRLLATASLPAFEVVEAGLGVLYDPRAGDATIGEMVAKKERELK